MQTIKNGFAKPTSPKLPFVTSPNGNIHVQTHFDGNSSGNKVIHVTNFNQNSLLPPDAFLDDSTDSFMDTDTEDCNSMSGKPSMETETYQSFITALKAVNGNTVVKTEASEPYHIPSNRFQHGLNNNLSPQKELKTLLKDIESSEPTGLSNGSLIDKLTTDVPTIEILEEPEQTYRARYESEGCKGPIHGISETGFPTVKICGYVGQVVLTVFVVTRDNEPHLHTATGPGSSKVPCKEVLVDNQIPAVQMVMVPEDENDDMVAVFDQLSIKRIRNWEADKELRKRGIDPAAWKSKKKEAKLYFQVEISKTNNHPAYLLKAYSRSFLCTAPSGNPEIWWSSLNECPSEGGMEMGLIGKKFAAGFKVRFFSKEDDGLTWESFAEIDRGKSNLNACVIKVPPYKDVQITDNIIVYLDIRAGPEKEPRSSDPFPFTYTPIKLANSGCENCANIKGVLQTILGTLNINDDTSVTSKETQITPIITISKNVAVKPVANVVPNVTIGSSDLRTLLQQTKGSDPNSLNSIGPSVGSMLYKVGGLASIVPVKSNPPSSTQQMFTSTQQILSINASTAKKPRISSTLTGAVLPSTAAATQRTNTTLYISNLNQVASNSGRFISELPKPVVSMSSQPLPTQMIETRNYRVLPVVNNVMASSQISLVGLNPDHPTIPIVSTVHHHQVSVTPAFLPISSVVSNNMEIDKVKEEQTSPNFQYVKSFSEQTGLLHNSSNPIVYNLGEVPRNGNTTTTPSEQPPIFQTQAADPQISSSKVLNESMPINISQELQTLRNHVESLKKQIQYGAIRQRLNFQPIHQMQPATHNSNLLTQTQYHQQQLGTVQQAPVHETQQPSLQQTAAIMQPTSSQTAPLIQANTIFSVNTSQHQITTPTYSSNAPTLPQSHLINKPLAASCVPTQGYPTVSALASSTSFQMGGQQQPYSAQSNGVSMYQQEVPNTQQPSFQTPPPTPTVHQANQQYSPQKHVVQSPSAYQQLPVTSSMYRLPLQAGEQFQDQTQSSIYQSVSSSYQQPVVSMYQQPETPVYQAQQTMTSLYQPQQEIAKPVYQQQATTTVFQQIHASQPVTVYKQPITTVYQPPQQQTSVFQQPSQMFSEETQSNQPAQLYNSESQQANAFSTTANQQMSDVTSQFYQSPEQTQNQQIFSTLDSINQWIDRRPSINDAIKTNKVGYSDNGEVIKQLSQPTSPMEIKVTDNDNDFLKTFQELNNTKPCYPTNSQPSDQSMQQHMPSVESTLAEHNEVSVDYSDAYRKMKENESNNTWNQAASSIYSQSNHNEGW